MNLPRFVVMSLLPVMTLVLGFVLGVQFDDLLVVLNSEEESTLLEIERSFWKEKLIEARSQGKTEPVIRMYEDKFERVNEEFRRSIPY